MCQLLVICGRSHPHHGSFALSQPLQPLRPVIAESMFKARFSLSQAQPCSLGPDPIFNAVPLFKMLLSTMLCWA